MDTSYALVVGKLPKSIGLSAGTDEVRRDRVRRGMDILLIILTIIFPPLGVGLKVGLTGQFWLNVLLTILGFIPGVIHGIYVILSRP